MSALRDPSRLAGLTSFSSSIAEEPTSPKIGCSLSLPHTWHSAHGVCCVTLSAAWEASLFNCTFSTLVAL
jgi:hypothetical protein